MAGSVGTKYIAHRPRGIVRTDVTITTDAAGIATATVVGVGFGRLVGVESSGTGAPLITVTDTKSGAVLLTHVPTPAIFGNTTTGDTTGGTSEDLWTTGAAHGLSEGAAIVFTSITGGGTVAVNTKYFVTKTTGFAATTFCLSSTAALSAATTKDVEIGASDVSASSWFTVGAAITPRHFRPSRILEGATGTAIASDANHTNQNRDIFLTGKVSVSATGGVAAEACVLALIVDEEGLGDIALTV